MTTVKAIALTRWTFLGKVMSLLFNMLSMLVITFLQRSKHLLISWLQSPSAVILEPKKTKHITVFIVSPSICHEVMGPDAIIFVSSMLCCKPAFHSSLSPSSIGFVVPLYFLGLQNHSSHEIRRRLPPGRKAMTNLESVLKAEILLCQQRSIQWKLWFFQ